MAHSYEQTPSVYPNLGEHEHKKPGKAQGPQEVQIFGVEDDPPDFTSLQTGVGASPPRRYV